MKLYLWHGKFSVRWKVIYDVKRYGISLWYGIIFLAWKHLFNKDNSLWYESNIKCERISLIWKVLWDIESNLWSRRIALIWKCLCHIWKVIVDIDGSQSYEKSLILKYRYEMEESLICGNCFTKEIPPWYWNISLILKDDWRWIWHLFTRDIQ